MNELVSFLLEPITIPILVFIVATMLQLIGIAVAYSKLFPPLDSILFRDYISMKEAMVRMEDGDEILQGDKGFDQIAGFIVKDINKKTPSILKHKERLDNVKGISKKDIVKLSFSGIPKSHPGLQVGVTNNEINVDYKDINSNTRKTFDCQGIRCGSIDVYQYKVLEAIENKRISSLFWYAVIFFTIGTLMQLTNIIVNIGKS